jgi:inner membrane protein
MFNSTHTLVGLAVGRTGLDRWIPRAAWAAVVASNLPDIDIVTQFAGTTTYLDHHRGFTHTILGIPVLSLALAGLMCAVTRSVNTSRPAMFWKYLLIAFIAMSTHPLLDWANTYGVRPFLPVNGRWYYGDTLFIIDPWLDLILLIGIIIARRASAHKRLIATASLAISVIYIGGMIELRNIAERQLQGYTRNIAGVLDSAVAPEFLDPLHWTGLVETQTEVSSYRIDERTGVIREEHRLTKAVETKITSAAEATHTAAVFRSFARFPVTRVESTDFGYRVLLIDFRFFRSPPQTALAAEIILSNELRVISESTSFVQPLD